MAEQPREGTDVYLRLDYRGYKHLEEQLRNFEDLETVHTSVDGYYHKALRVEVGYITFEFQGPAVKEPIRAPETIANDAAEDYTRE